MVSKPFKDRGRWIARSVGADMSMAVARPDALSTPVAVGDVLLVGCRDYTLYGLRRTDLSIAWTYSYWFSWIESTPAVADGVAYVGGSDFARITALDPATGRARWSTPSSTPSKRSAKAPSPTTT